MNRFGSPSLAHRVHGTTLERGQFAPVAGGRSEAMNHKPGFSTGDDCLLSNPRLHARVAADLFPQANASPVSLSEPVRNLRLRGR
jgi:hypothetical protein